MIKKCSLKLFVELPSVTPFCIRLLWMYVFCGAGIALNVPTVIKLALGFIAVYPSLIYTFVTSLFLLWPSRFDLVYDEENEVAKEICEDEG